jgi:hypothetical protein
MQTRQNQFSRLRDMLRGLSLALLTLHFYYYCYGLFQAHNLTLKIIDRFAIIQARSGMFHNPHTSKGLALLFWLLSMIITSSGGSGRRRQAKTVIIFALAGLICYFGTAALMHINGDPVFIGWVYVVVSLTGFILLLYSGSMVVSFFTLPFGGDVFNATNESFPQEERLLTNPYSVNLRARYRFRNRVRHSRINCINLFRGVAVWGSAGAGKTYFIIRPFISQLLEKQFCLFVYDFKFDDLTRITYNNLLKYESKFPIKPSFFVIDFDHLEQSNRCNPLDPASMLDISDATESARTILLALNREWIQKQGDFFIESAIGFVTASMWFLRKYQDGKYCTLPHLIELIQHDYAKLFSVLRSFPEIETLINPFVSAFLNDNMETLDSQVASARIALSGLASPQLYYVLSGNEFTLDINNPKSPKVVCMESNAQKQQTYGAVLSLYVTRMIKLVNKKGQLPCGIILDELSTIYFSGMGNLLATSRSNKVGVVFGAQSISLLRYAYGREQADMLFNLPGNIFCGQANGDTARSMSDCFGKILQPKQSISTNSRDNSIYQSEQLDLAVPASKITGLSSGEFVGIMADDPAQKIKLKAFHCEILNDHRAIQKEEAGYKDLPKIRVISPDTVQNAFFAIKQEVDNLLDSQIKVMQSNPVLTKKIIVKMDKNKRPKKGM